MSTSIFTSFIFTNPTNDLGLFVLDLYRLNLIRARNRKKEDTRFEEDPIIPKVNLDYKDRINRQDERKYLGTLNTSTIPSLVKNL